MNTKWALSLFLLLMSIAINNFFEQAIIYLPTCVACIRMIWDLVLQILLMLDRRCTIDFEELFSIRFKRQLFEMIQIVDWLFELLIWIRDQIPLARYQSMLDHEIEIDVWNIFVYMISELLLNVPPHDVFICKGKLLEDLRNHVELRVQMLLIFVVTVFDHQVFFLAKCIKHMHLRLWVLVRLEAFFHRWYAQFEIMKLKPPRLEVYLEWLNWQAEIHETKLIWVVVINQQWEHVEDNQSR